MDINTNDLISNFKNNINNRSKTIAIIGLGYVGLPLAIEITKNKSCCNFQN